MIALNPLELTEVDRLRLETVDPPLKTYTWSEAVAAAIYVGGELFGEGKFNPDVIVSFPGPSALFAHLVLAQLPSREAMLRTRVHTALLTKEEVPDREGYRRFPTVQRYDKKPYAILLPQRIFSYDPQQTKIAIIDDTVISGTTMESMRSIFAGVGYPKKHICVACFVCLEARTHSFEPKPDIFDESHLAPEEQFMLPWGPSFGYVNISEL